MFKEMKERTAWPRSGPHPCAIRIRVSRIVRVAYRSYAP
jgi:hypothetical protein